MTQLFIDGQEAVLPIDFSCKIVNENPFFTKSGDYTLNITLSLENPVNAKIYKHINRINSLSRFENRTAIIVSDNKVIIKGEEVILKYSNNSIEIQILAGNSSLNYIFGNDLNLRDLDLGVAIINKNEIVANLSKDYPEVDYQLLPFYDRDLEFVGNKYSFIYDKTLRNMNFMQIKVFMDEKFNGLFPKTDDDYKYVDSITININNTNNYKEGIMIETNYSEPVLSCVDGIVISIYQDNELGDVIVIQDRNGLEYHYGNLANIDVKIYHSISRGQILGVGRITAEMNGEYYLAIKDGNKVLNVIEVVNS